jgi:hypothetical protein
VSGSANTAASWSGSRRQATMSARIPTRAVPTVPPGPRMPTSTLVADTSARTGDSSSARGRSSPGEPDIGHGTSFPGAAPHCTQQW